MQQRIGSNVRRPLLPKAKAFQAERAQQTVLERREQLIELQMAKVRQTVQRQNIRQRR